MSGIGTGPIDAVASRCGCAGKTPLDRVVRPALAELRSRLESVRIAGDLEAGLLPNTTALERSVVGNSAKPTGSEIGPPRFVAATFVGREHGADSTAFGDALAAAYRTWAQRGNETCYGADRNAFEVVDDEPDTANAMSEESATVVKGHSIQLEGATEPVVWGERMTPAGQRRHGYRAVNVDVVHAFPNLSPDRQAAVAITHALNDCYTQGAADDRDVRPIVAIPAGTELSRGRVRKWFQTAAPATVTVRDPAIVTHDGRGWQFGASATAVTSRTPPVRQTAIEPGDEVLLHRPLGALALYTGTVEDRVSLDANIHKRAVEALTTDHVAIARAIAASCPAPNEAFDPDRHLKWVCDISGPGIQDLVRTVGNEGCGLHLETVPLLNRDALETVREAWVVPDITVETNGPLAAIGSPSALNRFEQRLEELPIADPSRIGRVTDNASTLDWDDETALERYVERLSRKKGP